MQLDFKAIAQTPILDVATALGVKLTEKGDQWVTVCPISQLGSSTVFKITPRINRWVCFCAGCKKEPKQGGDVIELVKRLRRMGDPREAAALVLKLTGADKPAANPTTQQEAASSSKATGFDPLTYLQSLATEHDALNDLGILPETLVAFQAGYCSKGLLRGRLAVAWHDVVGTLKFFIGVSLNGDLPLYLLPKGQLVPFWFNTNRVDDDAEIHIVPSILDVMLAFENGDTNTLAPLRPVTADAMTSLQALCATKNLTVEF